MGLAMKSIENCYFIKTEPKFNVNKTKLSNE